MSKSAGKSRKVFCAISVGWIEWIGVSYWVILALDVIITAFQHSNLSILNTASILPGSHIMAEFMSDARNEVTISERIFLGIPTSTLKIRLFDKA